MVTSIYRSRGLFKGHIARGEKAFGARLKSRLTEGIRGWPSPEPSRKRRGEKRGFSIIELLVVIGIVTVLLAITLPGLSKVRETTNRLKCANNEKQIGLGMYAFQNDNKAFPIGTALVGYPSNLPEAAIPISKLNSGPYRPGAFAMILPYIGQEELYRGLEMDGAIDQGNNKELSKTLVNLYLCPAAKHKYGVRKAPHSLPAADTTWEPAVTDYNGLNGSARLWTNAPGSGVIQNMGGFSERKALRLTDFTDAHSETIYVSETVDFGRGVWIHGRPHYNQSAYAVNSKNGYNNGAGTVYPDGSGGSKGPGKGSGGTWGIGSDHQGGANALCIDGSVRFLRENLGPETLTALTTRNAGDRVIDSIQ